jgi:SAM-dependent methyltransferase
MSVDPVAQQGEARDFWNAASSGWAEGMEAFERGAASVTARLLELAGVRAGQRVLDVATGQGEPALTAARAVGPTGRVVGVDIAPAMLEAARRRAAGLGNVEFVEAAMESLDGVGGPFDVALSRFGLMLATDRAAALRALEGALVPGGVLAAAVWGPGPSHLLSAAPAALTELLELGPPPADAPGPFSLSDPAALAREVEAAGLTGVSVVEHVVPFEFDSVGEYLRFTRRMLPARLRDAIAERRGSADDTGTWEAVARAVERHARADGTLPLPSTALLVRAVRQASARPPAPAS